MKQQFLVKRGSAIIGVVIGGIGLIIFVLALIFALSYKLVDIAKTVTGIFSPALALKDYFATHANATEPPVLPTATKIDCSGAKIPQNYLPWIKQAANQYLAGDQAKLVAVIAFESSFTPTDISSTGAVGLGQFVVPGGKNGATNLSHDFFRDLFITRVPRANPPTVTKPEKLAFLKTYSYEGRLSPEVSIFATAHKLKIALKDNGGDFRQAYAISYNGEPGDRKFQNADRMLAIYRKIQADGGCKALNQPAGQLGADINKAVFKK